MSAARVFDEADTALLNAAIQRNRFISLAPIIDAVESDSTGQAVFSRETGLPLVAPDALLF
jgi:hypothetical protein